MFKMRFAPLFDAYLPGTSIPAFQRVKAKEENPEFNYDFADFTSANVNGIPLHHKGWTSLTTIYKVTLYCDVCELPVHSTKIYGKTREVHVGNYLEIKNEEKLKRDLEKVDREVFRNLNKEIELEKIYRLQCSRCGRWVAKGHAHGDCLDETYGICKYCANTLREILRDYK